MNENALNGGLQYVPQIDVQVIYLDFDGESTRYNGELLSVDEVSVRDAALSAERVSGIVAALNEKYFDRNVVFVTERPADGAFSTIFVGKTDAFAPYGDFAGLAETVDIGNKNKSDNAFVLLDSADGDSAIVSVISHEADHLLGDLAHGGAGLEAYAADWNVNNGETSTGKSVGFKETVNVYNGGLAVGTTINMSGTFFVSEGGKARETTVNQNGSMAVSKGGSAWDTRVNPYGYFYVYSGGLAEKTDVKGNMHVYNGGEITDAAVAAGGKLELGSAGNILGGQASQVTVYKGGSLVVSSCGIIDDVTIFSGGNLIVREGTKATNVVVEAGGIWQLDVTADTSFQAKIADKNFSVQGNSVSDFTVTADCLLVCKQNTAAENIVLEHGSMTLAGGSASMTRILAGGQMRVSSKGSASGTTVEKDGSLIVSSGTVVRNTSIKNGGSLLIYKTAVHRGTLTLETGAKVKVNAGGVIDFSLENRKTSDDFLISDLSLITGTPTFTVTVSESMAQGSYKLAAGAAAFNGTITISTSKTTLGTLQVNGAGVDLGAETVFALTKNAGDLYLTVSDFVLPKPIAMANITVDTRENVIVTADFHAYWTVREFSRDGKKWQTYSVDGVEMKENGSVFFRGRDANGEYSEITEYQVKNIDRVAPVKPTAQADIVAATNKNVIVTAGFSTDSFVKEFSLDNKTWQTYPAGGVEMSANGTVYFRGKDKAGNISDVTEYTVSNIDKTPPAKPQAKADVTAPTTGNVFVTAVFSSDSVVKEFSQDGSNWQAYPAAGVEMSANGSVYFRGIDAVGNISAVAEYKVTNIDKVATDKPVAYADKTGPTNQNVIVKANFASDAVNKEYSRDGKTWQAYPAAGVEMSANGSVFFRNSDAVGNVSEVTEYRVTNIDRVAPTKPALSVDVTGLTYGSVKISAAFAADSVKNEFSWNGGSWQVCNGSAVVSANGKIAFRSTDAAGNTAVSEYVVSNIVAAYPENLKGTAGSLAWEKHPLAREFDVEISKKESSDVLSLQVEGNHVDLLGLPQGSYQWHVGIAGASQKAEGNVIVSDAETAEPQTWISDSDGSCDVFFANVAGTWKGGYYARHQGVFKDWAGTGEEIKLSGKNKIADVFTGSAKDPSVLVLTDDTCGDALFLEDVYTALGNAGRLAQIGEIRAGAGNDIIDMTSRKFKYSGEEMTIRGGEGDDVIWATGSDNDIFGDAGNDRIIGSTGFDLIVGGAGNDHMQSGGGDDIFAFGANWGNDTVVISDADSECILWFASGSANNWDSAKRIYKSGSKSVTVLGDGQVSLLFGNDPKGKAGQYGDLVSVGAFADKTSEKIFEKEGKGMLA